MSRPVRSSPHPRVIGPRRVRRGGASPPSPAAVAVERAPPRARPAERRPRRPSSRSGSATSRASSSPRSTSPSSRASTTRRASTSRSRTRSTPNLIPKLGQGNVDVGIADGTERDPGRQPGRSRSSTSRPIYGQFPSIVFGKATSGIKSAAELKGKKLGIPGKYGSSWMMLQALLASANAQAR